MKQKIIGFAAVLTLLICGVVFIKAYGRGCLSSKPRAEREHGLTLPQSTRDIRCLGDAWRGFLDRGATAIFKIDRAELPPFIAQLDERPGLAAGFPSGYGTPPASWETISAELSCASPVGDWLNVAVYELSSNTVGIRMYTDWN